MTADVIAMRHEAASIAERRQDAIRNHPASRSKQLLQVERQQALAALIAAIGDDRLLIDDARDLPLIVDVLLRNCPQAHTSPVTVAKAVEEAGDSHRASLADNSEIDYAGDAAFMVAQLAAGTAHTAAHSYMLDGCQMLADWLLTAAVR